MRHRADQAPAYNSEANLISLDPQKPSKPTVMGMRIFIVIYDFAFVIYAVFLW